MYGKHSGFQETGVRLGSAKTPSGRGPVAGISFDFRSACASACRNNSSASAVASAFTGEITARITSNFFSAINARCRQDDNSRGVSCMMPAAGSGRSMPVNHSISHPSKAANSRMFLGLGRFAPFNQLLTAPGSTPSFSAISLLCSPSRAARDRNRSLNFFELFC
jgi:hypothetical protein